MRYYVGTTDWNWYDYLRRRVPEDVNFWQPGGNTAFRALQPGEPFLFKLKSPYNAIGGLGFFAAQSLLPLSLAWDTFRTRNGFDSLEKLRKVVQRYRGTPEPNPIIGCIALTNPVFFREEDWVATPANWRNAIVRGKGYTSQDEAAGELLWNKVQALLAGYLPAADATHATFAVAEPAPQYRTAVLQKIRIGQGAFRLSVTDASAKRCAITGEKTLPVLEAAHIRPYAEAGPNLVTNGLLLRADMHKLFDEGYLTVTPEYRVQVSARIREEFSNGREYYRYHNEKLTVLPNRLQNRPGEEYLEYHNAKVFQG